MSSKNVMLARGDVLGGFVIEDVLGVGGMAIVYRAEQASLRRKVALKVLSPELNDDQEFRERFRREGQHVAALDHPNVVTVFDSGEVDGRLYLAMRLVDGATLAARLKQTGVSATETIAILRPIAEALDTAHAMGLVHRDVKPQNILLSESGVPYLTDFGVALLEAGGPNLTSTGSFIGSINYAAPEQVMGETPTAATDVYALAAVMYQCLTGEVPFPRDTEVGVMRAHLEDPPPMVSGPQTSNAALDAVIAHGLAKDRTSRYQRAGDLIRDAEQALSTFPEATLRAVPAFGRARPDQAMFEATVSRSALRRSYLDQAPPGSSPPPELPAPSLATDATIRRASSSQATVKVGAGAKVPPRLVLAGGLIVIVLAAIIALVAASGGKQSASHSTPPTVARSGELSLSFRAPWRAKTASVPGASALSAPILLASGSTTLVAGRAIAPAPVPGQLSATFGAEGSKPVPVRIAGRQAAEYRWTLASGNHAEAWVIPTTTTDVVLVCQTTAAHADDALRSCANLVSTADLSGGISIALGPDTSLARSIDTTLAPVSRDLRDLAGLDNPSLPSRAAAAATPARAEKAAGRSIRNLRVPGRYNGVTNGIATSANAEAAAFLALSRASARDNRADYVMATHQVERADTRLRAELASLAPYGLDLPTLPVLHLPGPPAALAPTAGTSTSPTSVSAQTYTPTPSRTTAAAPPKKKSGGSGNLVAAKPLS